MVRLRHAAVCFNIAALLPLSIAQFVSTDSYCSLCNDGNIEVAPEYNVLTNFEFQPCCPGKVESDCTLPPVETRSIGFDRPLLEDVTNVEENDICFELSNVALQVDHESECCQKCVCYGDPNCVSFNGTKAAYLVCDARKRRYPRSTYCWIDSEICLNSTDGNGDACIWDPVGSKGPHGYDPAAINAYGSPCKPKSCSKLKLYEVSDQFNFEICQGERGFIKHIDLTQNGQTYTMTAESCFATPCNYSSWTGGADESSFTCKSFGEDNEAILWYSIDRETGIRTTTRCVSVSGTYNKEPFKRIYLNIEGIYEPDGSRGVTTDGFCVNNGFDDIEPSPLQESCIANRPRDSVLIARSLCKNPSLIGHAAAKNCFKQYCEEHYSPYYKNVKQCDECFRKSNKHKCFCRSIVELLDRDVASTRECEKMVKEEGWEVAANYYLALDSARKGAGECYDDLNELPDTLGECEEGYILQYFDEVTGSWIDVKAIPARKPLCRDTTMEICYNKKTVPLFTNKVRLVQADAKACADQCLSKVGLKFTYRVSSSTSSPTISPTQAPTISPTNSPTLQPTQDPTLSPTDTPTPLPTPQPVLLNPPVASPPTTCRDYLCGTETLCQDLTYPEDVGEADGILEELPLCCGAKDSKSCEDHPIDPKFDLSRETETCAPICPSSKPCCGGLNQNDKLTVKLNFDIDERGEVCCPSCTCYGDPRCISFSGVKQSWIPCDSRVLVGGGKCDYTEEQCESTMDPFNIPCTWDKKRRKPYDVGMKGSPCQASGEVPMWMYNVTNKFQLQLWQGDRGIITEAWFYLRGNPEPYKFKAATCWAPGMNFDPPLPSGVSVTKSSSGTDEIVLMHDNVTKIQTRIRCKYNVGNKKHIRYMPRLGIEDLIDPELSTREDETSGFCVSNDMERTGGTEVTDTLDDPNNFFTGICQRDDITDSRVAKVFCAPTVVKGDSTEQCKESLCETFSYPNFGDSPQTAAQACMKSFNSNTFPTNWAVTVCKFFFKESEKNGFNECVDNIREGNEADLCEKCTGNAGWIDFRDTYLYPSNPVYACSRSPDDFPTQLSKCQSGVELQYLVGAEWQPFKGFPAFAKQAHRPCESGVEFNAKDHRELFEYAIRIHQRSLSKDCFVSTCATSIGSAPELLFNRSTSCS